jgi:hypothetical protein
MDVVREVNRCREHKSMQVYGDGHDVYYCGSMLL